MAKKRKIDFVLEENDLWKTVFRFYPRRSSCHSFGDEPPKSWKDVYKVYYNYRVIRVYKDDNSYEVLYDSHCDECSIIDDIGHRCLLLADGYETFEREDGERIPLLNEKIIPFGMGADWTITKRICTTHNWDEDDEVAIYYTFMLFNWNNIGFRFTLTSDKIKAFGEYLLECCEYMLEHGDPI